ncbi:uncharacterized protein TRIADDRAFT_56470 [Trichoplax adhaerens]|uniref:J domain-containing protein n=1 Tax=Trichoplax adhaerens TaxID=10228 RepID=B3RY83_TRIAD|nr:hypothetical protein TRIADDRAFT_56470 [Trichoplax adhaerens]EDV24992.1 hypothetical protein TRIADDRAFT_56470 [Trichoplax adhaerens]|eukprot:XP_002112882.1 hypothetical protein TRIADDRAFT_56470 [Trichoplax adhaerens]
MASGGTNQNPPDDSFKNFLTEVKAIEKRDSVLTSEQQIQRLTKPGSSYLNLNPFEVLQADPSADKTELKKKYRTLSILVHPDKNLEREESARKAFDAISKAYKLLEDEDETKKILQIIEDAKALSSKKLSDKRKEAKKLGNLPIEEDKDPELMKKFVRNTTVKLFADYELRRKQLERRETEEKKRQRNEEIVEEERKKKEAKFKDAWEKSRTNRVDNWRNFKTGGVSKHKEKYQKTAFKPPTLKPEKR